MSELLEDIEVTSSDLSAVDLVEDLHEHKSVENVSQMEQFGLAFMVGLQLDFVVVWALGWLGSAGWAFEWVVNADEGSSEDHEYQHDNGVPGGDAEDLSPDGVWKNGSIFVDWHSLDDASEWWLSWKSKSGKGVHDQVDPEELNWVDWRLSKDQETEGNGDESWKVNCDLELEESAYVMINIATPHNSSQTCLEITISQN